MPARCQRQGGRRRRADSTLTTTNDADDGALVPNATGDYLSGALGAHLDVLGGVVLVGLGVKILVEHLSGAA